MGDPSGFDDVDVGVELARRTIKWSKHGPGVLAAWVAEMDLGTAPAVRAAVAGAVERQQFGYPVADAATRLPAAVAAWSADRYEWPVDAGRVHLLPDVLRGVSLAIQHLSAPGSAVVLPTPAYMPFFDVPGGVGRSIVEVPLVHQGGRAALDLEGIDAAFAAGAGSLILCQPYNPVGRVFDAAELRALAQVVERHGARVISDEIHAPLTYPGTPHVPYASVSPEAAGHTLTLTAASKAWNVAGLRCAVAIVSNDADEDRWQAMAAHTHGASTIGIEASRAAFADGGPWLDDVLAYLDRTRTWFADLLAEHLPAVGYVPPEGTYLAWLDCRALDLPEEPGAWFLEHARVALNEGSTFGGPGAGFVRFNLATSRVLVERMVRAMGASLPG